MENDDLMVRMFVESCLEQLAGVEAAVLDMEVRGPDENEARIDAVFRAAHTIKGDAAALGASSPAAFCHAVESVLEVMRERRVAPTARIVGELLWAFDFLRDIVTDVRRRGLEDVSGPLGRLAGLAEVVKMRTSGVEAPSEGPDLAAAADEDAPSGPAPGIAVPAKELDLLVDRVGELGIAQTRLAGAAGRLRDRDLDLICEELERLGAELRAQALGMRMLPLEVNMVKYRRLVRDAADLLGKKASFALLGGAVKLDKAVIDRLNTPFIHLLRNAVDHGLETPAARASLGKPETGVIELEAGRQGGEVVIEIRDDGAGVDGDALFEKAARKGLVAPDAALTERQKCDLLFLRGVSTSGRVDAVSGRGVGMDAVRECVRSLRGDVSIHSRPGRGTTVRIRLPVSLAIIDCLRVRVGESVYFLHMDYVEECLELSGGENALPGGFGLLPLHGGLSPLLELRVFFELGGRIGPRPQVVVVNVGEGQFGLVVDEVEGRGQTVLKELGPPLANVPGVLGGAITENGDMALVLDIPMLAHTALEAYEKTGASGGERNAR